MLYGAETWTSENGQEKKLNVTEMKILRWSCRVTKLDRIKGKRIRGTVKVTEISKKMHERRLQWYGYVMRRDVNYVGKRVMVFESG